MKTLNEVITIMDGIDQTCTCCAYQYDCDETECVEKTALHYLKVLQKMQKAQPVTKGEWDELYNKPLTWKELRTMTGKPVWLERPEWKEWLLVSEIDEGKCEMYLRDKWGNGVIVNGRNIGYWRAYRNERE